MKMVGLERLLVSFFVAYALASPAAVPLQSSQEEIRARSALAEPWKPVVVDVASGGTVRGRSRSDVESFNAIPYADPPVGPLRLRPPVRFSGSLGAFDGTGTAPSCPQMRVSEDGDASQKSIKDRVLDGIKDSALQQAAGFVTKWFGFPSFDTSNPGQEDCLTLDIQRPTGTKAGDKLPVLFWIFGGAFEGGGSSSYDASNLFATAVPQGQPFIFVAINHRVAGFGFMPGREILAEGSANLGLLDQRLALEWVADNIESFGGDPDKVTLWGVSSGGISVFDQMLLYGGNATYKGKSLFRGAIVNSGGIAPAERVDSPKGQAIYDSVVREAGCSQSPDSLECLRQVDYPTFLRAANSVPSFHGYTSVALSYLPRPDGEVLPDSPERLVENGQIFAVPMIIGNIEDEGTIISLYQKNVSTTDDMTDYLSKLFFPAAPREKLREFVELYEPADTEGSPFGTLAINRLYPGFKRVAAILGDLTFSLSRRTLQRSLAKVKPQMPVWSYLGSYGHSIPFVGSFHALDTLLTFSNLDNNAVNSCRTYYFNFLYNLDPNRGNDKAKKYAAWPLWKEAQELMWFKSLGENDIIKDDFRSNASAWIDANVDILHL